MDEIAESNRQVVDFCIAAITKEMSGAKRFELSKQLATLIGANVLELFRQVEEKTKAKDKGRSLSFFDQMEKEKSRGGA
jgi:hypothetical protein